MIRRYADKRIDEIWSDEAKLKRWDESELAMLLTRLELEEIPYECYKAIETALQEHPTDIEWWQGRESEIQHDLNAYLDERRRHIPVKHQHELHRRMTSYDTEDPALARALLASVDVVQLALADLQSELYQVAHRHRFTPMLERTHGQWAKLRSFGSRVMTWQRQLRINEIRLRDAREWCRYSRMSGAIGNYGGDLTPEHERMALQKLGLVPFVGATQIGPRELHLALAQALGGLALTLQKISIDIRLGARSGCPLWHEPFGKKQKGSSAMPHKKNTITTEQMGGMVELALTQVHALERNVVTWEARAIEQSCVERVAWPDLFHVILRMLRGVTRVTRGLQVYPDNMLREIIESRGTYASDDAQNFLGKILAARGIEKEDAYRIVQLASFNALEPSPEWSTVRDGTPATLEVADRIYNSMQLVPAAQRRSIDLIIRAADLVPSAELEWTQAQVTQWNELLRDIFTDKDVAERWKELFSISYQLRGDSTLFDAPLVDGALPNAAFLP